jgi:hypothetical protein
MQSPLKVGDLVVVGSCMTTNGQSKFIPVDTRGEKITVERIWEETPGTTRVDLNWGSLGRSKVYMHDESKLWHRVSNFN